jgi:hypothetical protein
MISKVISGGQTGSDIAGLKAAKSLGIETGGHIPKGFLTLDGAKPNYATEYNLIEHSSPKYPPRTALNVKNSDGTILIASNFNSPGTKLTAKYATQYKKPFINIDSNNAISVNVVFDWINKNNIHTVNIAGNSESRSVGIEEFATKYLVELFTLAKN